MQKFLEETNTNQYNSEWVLNIFLLLKSVQIYVFYSKNLLKRKMHISTVAN